MKNLITLSKINVQILGSYVWIYLYLIPAFYLKQWNKCFANKYACIVCTLIIIAILFALGMFIHSLFTIGVHFQY